MIKKEDKTPRQMIADSGRVLFRVIHLKKGLILSKEPVTVTIEDPESIKIEMYSNITSETGVSSLQFQLSDSTNLGKWSIIVEKENEDTGFKTLLQTAHFTVEEFVPPTFDVEMKVDPSYIVMNSRQNPPSIVVKAMYTFGKGVQGTCQLLIERKEDGMSILLKEKCTYSAKGEILDSLSPVAFYTTWLKYKSFCRYHNLLFTFNFSPSNVKLGESGAVEFPTAVLSSMIAASDLTLKAKVTDITGRIETSEQTIKVYESKARLQFLKKTTRIIKIGLPAYIAVSWKTEYSPPIKNNVKQGQRSCILRCPYYGSARFSGFAPDS
ncbi:alpha-2-macroglobulin 2 [Elysia marginata]|uniref:Alpha-2-macroglobulin 2 n=1 Tax=Elysia marginata TaxID=1093978 RepID=A0AAV4J4U3_9GAST|nr:alpha-2-macroglobulin 2 [Elysia marginata]